MAFIPNSISTNSIPQPITQPQFNQPTGFNQPQFNQPTGITGFNQQPQFSQQFSQPTQQFNQPTQSQPTQSQFTQPQLSQSQSQPQPQFNQNTGIFVNADAFSSIPTTAQQPKQPKASKPPRQPAAPAEKVQITESFDTTPAIYNEMIQKIPTPKQMYPYTESLVSPYEGECPFATSLLCAADSATNLLFFDSTLLSVKLTEFKDEPKRIYQVSLADLKKYYDINSKSMTTFKGHFKITPQTMHKKNLAYYNFLINEQNAYTQNPQSLIQTYGFKDQTKLEAHMKKVNDKVEYLKKEITKLETAINQAQSKEKETVPIIYNTATYPITDKGCKWLTISYLIPYLMFASPRFINHTSNLLNNLLIATSYNMTIGSTHINDYLESLKNYKFVASPSRDAKFKLHPTLKDESNENENLNEKENLNEPQKPKPKQAGNKLILQVPKLIIPRLDDDKKNDPKAITSYNAYINQNVINQLSISIKQLDLKSLQTFYSQLSKSISKLLNPADMLCITAFNRLKTLNSQISIIKVNENQIDAQGKIIDPE